MKIKEIGNNYTFKAKYAVIPASELAMRMRQNMSYSEMAQEFNVPLYVVEKSMRHFSLKALNEREVHAITRLYNNGRTAKEICDLLNYPIKYIQFVIRSLKEKSKKEIESGDLVSSIVRKLNLDPSVLDNLK